jgi:hypothetical protein
MLSGSNVALFYAILALLGGMMAFLFWIGINRKLVIGFLVFGFYFVSFDALAYCSGYSDPNAFCVSGGACFPVSNAGCAPASVWCCNGYGCFCGGIGVLGDSPDCEANPAVCALFDPPPSPPPECGQGSSPPALPEGTTQGDLDAGRVKWDPGAGGYVPNVAGSSGGGGGGCSSGGNEKVADPNACNYGYSAGGQLHMNIGGVECSLYSTPQVNNGTPTNEVGDFSKTPPQFFAPTLSEAPGENASIPLNNGNIVKCTGGGCNAGSTEPATLTEYDANGNKIQSRTLNSDGTIQSSVFCKSCGYA